MRPSRNRTIRPSEAGDFLFVSDQYNRAAGIVQRPEQLHDLKA
jgi:hypothetical protein